MDIINSNKKKEKLLFNGYAYTIHKRCQKKIRWRCSKYSSKKCRAILETKLDNQDPTLVKAHTHAADSEQVNVVKSMDEMKTVARETTTDPGKIFVQGVRSLSNATRSKMMLEDSVKRTLRNQRKIDAPINPTSLKDLIIEDNWTTTGETVERRFLLSDNGPEASERIVIFATDQLLQILDSAVEWSMDGTFEVAPRLFKQLYVLRARTGNFWVTIAYCLLERKTNSTYEEMLRTIITKCNERDIYPDPQIIHVDFEEAVMTAVKRVLGEETKIQGCFYHLTQSTYRKVQKLGLQGQYLEDESLSRFCGMLDGLAFLPENDVEKGLNYLRELPPPMGERGMQLLDYFDTTYVNGTTRQIPRKDDGSLVVKVRRIAPRFPKESWNVNEVTKNDGERTNNQTEGWNNRFRHIVGIAHPTIWVFIEKIRDEQAADATKLAQEQLGVIKKNTKRSECADRQLKLRNICIGYDEEKYTIENFLIAISETIRTRTI